MQHETTDNVVELKRQPSEPAQYDMFLHYIPSADPNIFEAPEPANDN
jgi:hypothetical protein